MLANIHFERHPIFKLICLRPLLSTLEAFWLGWVNDKTTFSREAGERPAPQFSETQTPKFEIWHKSLEGV